MSTFFGLTPAYKLEIHDSIFAMVTYGKGGWTYSDLYNMPVYLRMYYMRKLSDAISKEAEATKRAMPAQATRPNIMR